jgi:membrane-associated phospholipid phosphatase
MESLPLGFKGAMNHLTKFGVGTYYLVFFGVATIVFWWMGRRKSAFKAGYVFACVVIAGATVDILRFVLGRYRPSAWITHGLWGFRPFSPIRYECNGCPSGHAAVAMGVAVALMNLSPRSWPWLLTAGAFVASTRVFLDSHYLSDVILGAYIGTATAVLLRLHPWSLKWLSAPPGTGASGVQKTPGSSPSVVLQHQKNRL